MTIGEKAQGLGIEFGTEIEIKRPGRKTTRGRLTRRMNDIGIIDFTNPTFQELVERAFRHGGTIHRQNIPFQKIDPSAESQITLFVPKRRTRKKKVANN
jgi:hypothetical protein